MSSGSVVGIGGLAYPRLVAGAEQIVVGAPRRSRGGGGNGSQRVTFDVDGEPLWFESPDLELDDGVDAVLAALWVPAIATGRSLHLPAAPSALLLAGLPVIAQRMAEWWGHRAVPVTWDDAAASPAPERQAQGAALAFSGGVDSFWTLLRGADPVALLVSAIGFDVPLADAWRAEAVDRSLRAVAADRGCLPVLIRTNLREHPTATVAMWQHAHGGALAAVGHLLSPDADRLLITASYPAIAAAPWGSHPDLDHRWSTERVSIEHVGADRWRAERLRTIDDEPLVHEHLRVCFEKRDPRALNCGRCEKCLRTRLILAAHGRPDRLPLPADVPSIADGLDALGALPHVGHLEIYRAVVREALPPSGAAAVGRLLARSEEALGAAAEVARVLGEAG